MSTDDRERGWQLLKDFLHDNKGSTREQRENFVERIAAALADARREGYETAREDAAQCAENACLVPPDGGSVDEQDRERCGDIAMMIRTLNLQPQQPQRSERE